MRDDYIFSYWVKLGAFMGSGFSAVGGLSFTSWMSIIGVCLGFATFGLQWHRSRSLLAQNERFEAERMAFERERLDREFPENRAEEKIVEVEGSDRA